MTDTLRDALGEIAGKNDLSGVSDIELASAACNALHECELIARAALAAAPAVGGELQDIADEIEQSDGIALMLTGCSKQLGIRRTAMVIAALRAQPASRVTGAIDIIDEAACLIWSELCPDSVMGDDERPHYEAAAKAVLSALPLRGRDSVLLKWQEKLADLRDMKTRGDLTRDWGECSLINAQSIVDDLTASASPPEQPAAATGPMCPYCFGLGKIPDKQPRDGETKT